MCESGCLNDGNFHNLGAGKAIFTDDVKIVTNLVVDGNLDVNGTMTTLNTENTVVKDVLIKLGQDDITTTKDLGLIFTRGDGTLTDKANRGLLWDRNNSEFTFVECNTEDGETIGDITIDEYAPLKCGGFIAGEIKAGGTPLTVTNTGVVTIESTLDVTGDTSVSTFDSSGATSLATGGGVVNISLTGVLTTVKGTLNVDEAVTLDTTLDVTGITTLNDDLTVANNATVGGTLVVTDNIELGHATDTTLSRDSAGVVSIQGNVILTTGSTITVPQGGTGATTFTNGGILLGSGTGAITAAAVLENGQILIGDNDGAPAPFVLTGDVSMDNGGVVTIANDAVETAMIGDVQVTLGKIANSAPNTVLVRDANTEGVLSAKEVTTTQILIGNGAGFTAAALTGDVSMDNGGVVTIANDAVETAMIADDQVTGAKIENNPTIGGNLTVTGATTLVGNLKAALPSFANYTAVGLTEDTTLAVANHSAQTGKYVTMNVDAKTITLPAVAIGATFIIVNTAADGGSLLTISPAADDKFLVNIAGEAGANNKDIINPKTSQKQYDYVKLVGLTADGWLIDEIRGVWADEG